jgi:Protein of unknown function (DUF3892)
MAQTLQVTCISKTNRGGLQEHIDYIGGSAWRFTEAQAISFIEGGMFDFFVKAGGRAVRLVVAIRSGHKYLKTVADGDSPDNLLALHECRSGAPAATHRDDEEGTRRVLQKLGRPLSPKG